MPPRSESTSNVRLVPGRLGSALARKRMARASLCSVRRRERRFRSGLLGACLLAAALPALADDPFAELADRSDLVVFGQVLQTGELDGEPVVTIAIDRPLRGVEPAGALTFVTNGDGWRVGQRSAFFLRRSESIGMRLASLADPATSLHASAALLQQEPVRAMPTPAAKAPEPAGISLPGIAAGLVTALGILGIARLRRAHQRKGPDPIVRGPGPLVSGER